MPWDFSDDSDDPHEDQGGADPPQPRPWAATIEPASTTQPCPTDEGAKARGLVAPPKGLFQLEFELESSEDEIQCPPTAPTDDDAPPPTITPSVSYSTSWQNHSQPQQPVAPMPSMRYTFVWTQELHCRFEAAVNTLGIELAKPQVRARSKLASNNTASIWEPQHAEPK